MKRGFYTIMAAQFFSSLADNALFVAAVELLRITGAPKWQPAALVPMFALFYVVLAPFVGALNEPLLRPVRKVVPPLGGMDLSVLVVLILLQIAQLVLSRILVVPMMVA